VKTTKYSTKYDTGVIRVVIFFNSAAYGRTNPTNKPYIYGYEGQSVFFSKKKT